MDCFVRGADTCFIPHTQDVKQGSQSKACILVAFKEQCYVVPQGVGAVELVLQMSHCAVILMSDHLDVLSGKTLV